MRRAWAPDRLISPGEDGRRVLRSVNANWNGDVGDPAVPRRRLAVICCMDCRLDPLSALWLDVGDAHVFRNAGGRVTPEALAALERSQRVFGTVGVVVLSHTDCRYLEVAGDPTASVREGMGAVQRSRVPSRDGVGGAVVDLATGNVTTVAKWADLGQLPRAVR